MVLSVVVSGAGVDGVNGVYVFKGFYRARPIFYHMDRVFKETYYLARTVQGWMFVSSSHFPSRFDVQFYYSTVLEDEDGLLPPSRSTAWYCSPRKMDGIRELLEPPPQKLQFSWALPASVAASRLAALMITAEAAIDARQVNDQHGRDAKRGNASGALCEDWRKIGSCPNRTLCTKHHPLESRNSLMVRRPVCAPYITQAAGCTFSSYICNFVHASKSREDALNAMLYKLVQ